MKIKPLNLKIMTKNIVHVDLLSSKYFRKLSEGLIDKFDIYLCNVDLTEKQQKELIGLIEESCKEMCNGKD